MSMILPHPVRTHRCYSSFRIFKKNPLPPPALLPRSSSWLRQIDGPRFLLRTNGILLTRAEDKVRGSSPTSSGQQQKNPQANSDKQLQDLSPPGTCDPLCSIDDTSSEEFEASNQPKTDLLKALAILAAAGTGALAINHSWVAANQDLAMALLFGIGYAGIIFEESLAFNKSGVGLLMAVSLWVIRSIGAPSTEVAVSELSHASAEVGFVTFFLSSVLDNLTSTIVMVSLLKIGASFRIPQLLNDYIDLTLLLGLENVWSIDCVIITNLLDRLLGAVVVIAANAGGAWTPIGDVTTTMLWIHGQISTLPTMKDLLIPSAISLAVPLALMSLTSFKALTGLPPYMGMLLGLGVLWILTDAIHYGESERQQLKVPQALSRIDTQGALFFLGILLSVSSLEAAGILREIANYLDAHIPNIELIASSIGVVSAIIDNVPLVAATMGMYDLSSFPRDSEFWQLVAYCAGTGGSMLVIGSAAGVAFMGMEKVDFFWYLRKVSGFAFAGYAAGIAAYLAVHNLDISLPATLAHVPFLSGS
ncbi:Sodium/proton antiporter 1 [Sesamum angolense]|uniref:Sodium/proton antiporter 1 n=1 Tax=Sesamum angolense TaxID=2727404 RepID=A0AAE2C159_9LAMI|nr:Sodium/proton antiporter 1 [Sesamum angolense]